MKYPSIVRFVSIILAIACASCGDDPKLVEKREKQKAEIARLSGELALINEKLKNLPPDLSADLEKARKQEEKQSAEVARLEVEMNELTERKRLLQVEFDSYRAKYPLK